MVGPHHCRALLTGQDPEHAAMPAEPAAPATSDWAARALDGLATLVGVLDQSGRICGVNSAWKDFAQTRLGAESDCKGVDYLGLLQGLAQAGDASAARAAEGIAAVLAGDLSLFETDFLCDAAEPPRWFLMQVSRLEGDSGCIVSHLDITLRKRTEASHAQLAAVLEATPDYVAMADGQGRLLYANRAMRQLRGLGLTPDAPLGAWETAHPPWAFRRIRDEAMPTTAVAGDWSGETALLDASGAEVPIHQVVLAHRDERGGIDFFSTVMRNQSASQQQAAELTRALEEIKRTQAQLVNSEKMASIGQLTAGVAHEINNPVGYLHSNLNTLADYVQDLLKVVAGYEVALAASGDPSALAQLDQLKRETDLAFLIDDIPKLLSESREGTQRVRKIVQDLKDFAHAGENEEWQWIDLRNSLDRTLNIVHNELKYKAEVHREYGELPELRCLPGQLNQVFMNLLVNAAHAIDSKGEVRVSARRVDDEIRIAVADTGCGMPPAVASRIFEPFFTTKPVGKGTGLGLSISYGIVKRHGGRIEVESVVGQGTCFRVFLPLAGPSEDAA